MFHSFVKVEKVFLRNRVVDGDTIWLHHQKPDVRLVGFNAPETRRAQCDFERGLGGKATARLRDLVCCLCVSAWDGRHTTLQLWKALRHSKS